MIRTILMVLLALFMIGGGINYFLTHEFYIRM